MVKCICTSCKYNIVNSDSSKYNNNNNREKDQKVIKKAIATGLLSTIMYLKSPIKAQAMMSTAVKIN